MASFNGLGITNAHVACLAGDEFPIFDGSARHICSALQSAGLKLQAASARVMSICKTFSITRPSDLASIYCSPARRLIIEADFHYPHAIGKQTHRITCTPARFLDQIADARTFLKDPVDVVPLETVRSERLLGLRKSRPLIVHTRAKILTRMRYSNEPARHKILDFLGDIYSIGWRVRGHFRLVRSGHQLTLALAEVLTRCIEEGAAGDLVCDAVGEAA